VSAAAFCRRAKGDRFDSALCAGGSFLAAASQTRYARRDDCAVQREFAGLKIDARGLSFSPADKEKELEVFYERFISQDISYFKLSPDFAGGCMLFTSASSC